MYINLYFLLLEKVGQSKKPSFMCHDYQNQAFFVLFFYLFINIRWLKTQFNFWALTKQNQHDSEVKLQCERVMQKGKSIYLYPNRTNHKYNDQKPQK